MTGPTATPSPRVGVLVLTDAGPGILHQLTGVIARHRGDIASVVLYRMMVV
jgi:hypothetical protein